MQGGGGGGGDRGGGADDRRRAQRGGGSCRGSQRVIWQGEAKSSGGLARREEEPMAMVHPSLPLSLPPRYVADNGGGGGHRRRRMPLPFLSDLDRRGADSGGAPILSLPSC